MKIISLAQAPEIVRTHLEAINAGDLAAIAATFHEDAYINDDAREIRGITAIRAFFEAEFLADSVTIDAVEVCEHFGEIIIRGRYNGTFDRSQLPEELIMSNYLSIRDGLIVAESIIFNKPTPYNSATGQPLL